MGSAGRYKLGSVCRRAVSLCLVSQGPRFMAVTPKARLLSERRWLAGRKLGAPALCCAAAITRSDALTQSSCHPCTGTVSAAAFSSSCLFSARSVHARPYFENTHALRGRRQRCGDRCLPRARLQRGLWHVFTGHYKRFTGILCGRAA